MHSIFFFFFNDTATTEIYTLSLHDALPIFFDSSEISESVNFCVMEAIKLCRLDTPIIFIEARIKMIGVSNRSEERFSRNAETDLVCRLLLEKKKKSHNVLLKAIVHTIMPLTGCSTQIN